VLPVSPQECGDVLKAQPHPGSSGVRPGYWTTADGVTVLPAPEMLPRIQDLLTRTWEQKYTRDRKDSGTGGKVPTGGRVTNVLRVENHKAFSAYHAHLLRVKSSRESGQVRGFRACTDGLPMTEKLDKGANEMFLWHGTNPEAANSIAKNDFKLTLAGKEKGSMFGPGIYLAENSSKSDEYAKEGDGVFVGQCALLLCRAVAGKVLTVEHAADHSSAVLSGSYDSVCGDRRAAVGTYREMIFFSPYAVYCEYVVLYTRSFGEVLATPAAPTPATPAPATAAPSNEVKEVVDPKPAAPAPATTVPSNAPSKVKEVADPQPSPTKTFEAFDNVNLLSGFTSRAAARFSEDVPPGCRLRRSMEYVKGSEGPGPWQWYGWQVSMPGARFRVSCWIKFLKQVPPPSGNFGLKIHGRTDNGWLRDVSADQWVRISAEGLNTNGDYGWVLLIFDSLQKRQTVRFTDFRLEVFDNPAKPGGLETRMAFDGELTPGFATPGGVRFSQDVPPGCGLTRSMEYVKDFRGGRGGQWYGWQVASGSRFKLTCWIKFLERVPPPSGNFGLKIHGRVDNSWLARAVPDKWTKISTEGACTHGDANWILLIFDSVQEPQTVRFSGLAVEIVS